MKKTAYELPIIGGILAMVSGSIDAYTFLEHGGVFAGLQTGNFILLGINISRMNWPPILRDAFSIILFAFGVLIIKLIQRRVLNPLVRKRIIIGYEIILLTLTALFANRLPNLLTIGLLDLAAAAKLQEFTLLNGHPFNPLMMTGNLRKVVDNSYLTILDHDSKAQATLIETLIVIASFIAGTVIMGITTNVLNQSAIVVTIAILLIITLVAKPMKAQ